MGELLDHLRRQFDYDDWANREILTALKRAQPAPAAAVRIFSHVVAAEWLWLTRLRQSDAPLAVWPELALREFIVHLQELGGNWNAYFTELGPEDLGGEIRYVNSKGEEWTSRVDDVLQHVLLHSAYHRGQIALSLRETGTTPPYTDFIHCIRQDLL